MEPRWKIIDKEVHHITEEKKGEKRSALCEFSDTITKDYGKARRILLDTGPAEGRHRIMANLKRRTCPHCKTLHYSSFQSDYCSECEAIVSEEARVGRKLTGAERRQLLEKIGLL